jgi:sigma-B regulation protein RsbU (phosphoserine phosphatase)
MEGTQTSMAPAGVEFDAVLHEQLTERRERLEIAKSRNGFDPDFSRLLSEVDAALSRFEKGTYGLCEECHDPIESERLLADPLVRVCLGDLTDRQRHALEDDLQLASSIQNALLPKTDLGSEFWQVDFHYQPAGIVSGDYCDVIAHDGELYFILGDVSGKGMAASLLMSNLHAMFHSLVPLGLPLHELMGRANHMFCESTLSNQYATLVFGKINAKGEVEICNAGHLPPIIVKSGENITLDAAGLPLGLFCDSNFAAHCFRLDAGETLLLYTDGVTEANDHTEEEFGIARLLESVNGSYADGPSGLVRNCVAAVESFRGSATRNDDLTILAVKFAGAVN